MKTDNVASSNKENGKKPKVVKPRTLPVKRKEKAAEIHIEPGTVLTPAMQDILNKKKNEVKPKGKKKN